MVSNGLPNGLSNAKLFTGGTSLFTLVDNVSTSAGEVNKGIVKIIQWVYQ